MLRSEQDGGGEGSVARWGWPWILMVLVNITMLLRNYKYSPRKIKSLYFVKRESRKRQIKLHCLIFRCTFILGKI
jgi:hypothetical protein